MKTQINTNHNRKHDLTIEEVKSCAWFATFTDEQSLEVIRTIKELTKIAYYAYQKEQDKK
jgi:hypothetical protein